MNNKCNALDTNVAQRGEINEQHQNVIEPIVQKDLIALSIIHQATP